MRSISKFFLRPSCPLFHGIALLCKYVAHAFSTLDKMIPGKYQF